MALSLSKLRMEYSFHLLNSDSSDNAHMEDSDPERLRLE